jgi:pimeloyl-ACP methyl ester carboxylesterase
MCTLRRELCLPLLSLTLAMPLAFTQTASTEPESFRITVPENREKKNSRPLSLAVARFAASGVDSTIPLIYVSGGSGAGISAVTGPRRPFFEALRQLGDVVAFDIRGTGRSTPRLACDAPLRLEMGAALTRAALIAATRDSNRTCAEALRTQGFDVSGYNGRQVAEDIEDLRKHLGAARVRLFGISTGTHLALEYVRAHRDRVAAAFLAGTEGPGQTAHLPSGMDAAVARLTASKPQVLGLLREVFAGLDAKAVTVDVNGTPVGIGGYDARVFVASTLGDRAQMARLEPLFTAMKAGNFGNVAGLKLQALRQPFQSPWESLHDCQAGTADARQRRVEHEAATALLGYATLDFVEACDGWGAPVLPARYRTPVKSTVPALFISGTLDGRTPVANADEVRRGFRNSAHLIVEGASHGDDLFLSSPAILESVLAFARKPFTAVTRAVRAP